MNGHKNEARWFHRLRFLVGPKKTCPQLKQKIELWLKSEKQWYFVTKIVLTYSKKKLFLWSRFFFEIRGWRPKICKHFEITRTICSNSERSEQFLVTECFFLEVSQIILLQKIDQLIVNLPDFGDGREFIIEILASCPRLSTKGKTHHQSSTCSKRIYIYTNKFLFRE